MTNLVKVTMNLTDSDVRNTEVIHEVTESRSKAQAVSTALALTRFLIDFLRKHPGGDLVLRLEDGSTEKLYMPELERARGRAPAAAK